MYLGALDSYLIAGTGPLADDPAVEWTVLDAFNQVVLEPMGRVNLRQSYADGDPMCDRDSTANGFRSFRTARRFNVDPQ